jgi:alpha-tubulin suppressor-like RCC1 family protein
MSVLNWLPLRLHPLLPALTLAAAVAAGAQIAVAQTPETIGGQPVIEVAAGSDHSCALVESGAVWCWGSNTFGQLGDGSTDSSLMPVQVANLTAVQQISVGTYHSCALRRNGRVFCWGSNGNGQLGVDSSQIGDSLVPILLTGITDATQIDVATYHGCLVRATGRVFCWGDNSWGQLGDDTYDSRWRAARVVGSRNANVVQVGTGETFSCLLRETGRVFCWGSNFYAELGDGTIAASPWPVAVAGVAATTQLSVGQYHSCALRSSGRIWCWGYNSYGALGNRTTDTRLLPGPVRNITDAVGVAAGGYFGSSCALRSNGRTMCWGSNISGEAGIGNNTDEFLTVPVWLRSMNGTRLISVGYGHTCGVKEDGTAWCWGFNGNGQLGDGTQESRSTPVRVAP